MSYTVKLPFSGQSVRATQLTGDHKYVNLTTGTPDSTDHVGSSASAYDFALAAGTQLLAIASGVVVSSVNVVPDNQGHGTTWATSNPYGNFVTISYDLGSGNTLYATYAHLKQNSGLSVNTVVAAGDVVGLVGVTGDTSGPHLHIQFGLTTASATGGGLKADAQSNYDIVSFGDPVGLQYVQTYDENEYIFSSTSSLAAQVHAQAISLTNNTYSTSGTVGNGFSTASWNADDYYSFVAPSNGTLSVHLAGLSNDIDLRLLDANGQRLNQSIQNGTAAEDITQTVAAGSTYLVHVDPFNYDSSNYALTVSFQPTSVAGSISISDVTISEGNSGTKLATFTVTRTGGTAAFTVGYATADGTATVADGDYVAASGTLSFGTNVNTQTFSVAVNGDAKVESDE
jgi:hypothetical protein